MEYDCGDRWVPLAWGRQNPTEEVRQGGKRYVVVGQLLLYIYTQVRARVGVREAVVFCYLEGGPNV